MPGCDSLGAFVRKPLIAASSLVLGLALLLPACSHNQSDDSGGGEKPRHAAEGEQLRDTMRELAKQTNSSPADKLPPDPESAKEKKLDPAVFEDAAKLASQLAKTAETIPTKKRDRALSEPARGDFEKLAMDLGRRAKDFEAAAKAQNVEQMQRSFNAVRASCIACHSRFFDMAGDLDFPRAAATPSESATEIFASTAR
jgi:cytochrome c556